MLLGVGVFLFLIELTIFRRVGFDILSAFDYTNFYYYTA